ncbi:hypothetical protein ACJO2E_02420 [Marinobacter sp. M1N3S26]|uniref:hypothetical protein n=1 Tax=Marinobacter sp. M1N3S26 TaxID=3382299 RepID=UPI00387AA2EF
MVTRICVLRSGGEYTPAHVQWLARQVPGLKCLSDAPVPGVETIPLRHPWPKWWAKLALFEPEAIPGDLLYIDLDTVIIGDLAEFEAVGQTTMLSDFYWPARPASGLMYIAEADKAQVWERWLADPAGHMARKRGRGGIGDQGFLAEVLAPARWQDLIPDRVVSYKVNCRRGLPPGADVVCFHGKPRPWGVNLPWVPKLWQTESTSS